MKIGSIDLGERPVFLAPMEDVTDISFRLIVQKLRGGHGYIRSSYRTTR